MNAQLKSQASGAALAMAAAALMGCTATAQPTNSAKTSAPAGTNAVKNAASNAASNATIDLAHCYGVNKCKGHNDCKTANNDCKGMASCKGQGFVAMPVKACGDIGGENKDDWRGKTTKVDLVHCYGVNIYKGHNDCKTADNACKGMASCQGQGYVNTSAASCADVGGNVGS